MGMFTTVVHPDTGLDIQFKTGDDQCARYRLGDEVEWWVNPREPLRGCCLDGVYDGEAFHHEPEFKSAGLYWVVIKDHRIHAIEPVEDTTTQEEWERYGHFRHGYSTQEAWVAKRYGVAPPSLDLWTQEAWADKARQDEESKRRLAEWEAEDYGLSTEKRAGKAFGRFTRDRMRQESFFRKIIRPLTADGGFEIVSQDPCIVVDKAA